MSELDNCFEKAKAEHTDMQGHMDVIKSYAGQSATIAEFGDINAQHLLDGSRDVHAIATPLEAEWIGTFDFDIQAEWIVSAPQLVGGITVDLHCGVIIHDRNRLPAAEEIVARTVGELEIKDLVHFVQIVLRDHEIDIGFGCSRFKNNGSRGDRKVGC